VSALAVVVCAASLILGPIVAELAIGVWRLIHLSEPGD
jgi:hypothetical protein